MACVNERVKVKRDEAKIRLIAARDGTRSCIECGSPIDKHRTGKALYCGQFCRGAVDRRKRTGALAASKKKYVLNHPERMLLKQAQGRAKKQGIPFNIEETDIVIPDVCPVLGLPLTKSIGKPTCNSPSVDKIIPDLGYVKGNVKVISYRANRLKNDASLAELRAITAYVAAYSPR